MSRRKQKPWAEETAKLEEFIDENELRDDTTQFGPYHFRIKTYKTTMDIWAGAKKYFIKGTSGSREYQNISELKQYLL